MRLLLYGFAVVAGLALAVVSLVADLPVATLIFGVLIAVCGVGGLVFGRSSAARSAVDSAPASAAASSVGSAPASAAAGSAESVESVGGAGRRGAPAWAAALDRGAALEAAGDEDGALAAYREAAEADAALVAPVGHLRVATVLARRRELPAAEEHARLALAYPTGEHTVAATILLASVALRAGKPDLAKSTVAELAGSDNPAHAAAGRSYQAMFAVADGDVSPANLETLRASSAAGDQLTGTFLELVEQATTDPSAMKRPEPGTAAD
jgi:hypothetical protein